MKSQGIVIIDKLAIDVFKASIQTHRATIGAVEDSGVALDPIVRASERTR